MTRLNPRTVLQVLRQRPSGRAQCHRVVRIDGGSLRVEATPWLRAGSDDDGRLPDPVGAWTPVDVPTTSNLVELLRRTPALTALRRRQVATVTVDVAELSAAAVTSLLRPSATGGPEDADAWGEATAERWAEIGESLPYLLPGATWLPRWATVNDLPVGVLVLSGGTPRASSLSSVLMDADEGVVVPIEEIASYSTFSEGSFAPVSWCGGSRIDRVGRAVAVVRGTGDDDTPPALLPWPRTATARAVVLKEWIDRLEADVAAALTLEPLDPAQQLDDDSREEWQELISECGASLAISAGGVGAALRHLLDADEDSRYRATRLALADPLGEAGQTLLAKLRSVAEGAPLVDLLYV